MRRNKSLNTFEEQFNSKDIDKTREKMEQQYEKEITDKLQKYEASFQKIMDDNVETTGDCLTIMLAAANFIRCNIEIIFKVNAKNMSPEDKSILEKISKQIVSEANLIADNIDEMQKEHEYDRLAIVLAGSWIIDEAIKKEYITMRTEGNIE